MKESQTLDLFETPDPAPARSGSLAGLNTRIAHMMSAVIRESSLSRFDIAAKMSDLLGEEVTKTMLDAYTAESREDQNIPGYRLFAFVLASGCYESFAALLKPMGFGLVVGRDARVAALVQMKARADSLAKQVKRMEREIGCDR